MHTRANTKLNPAQTMLTFPPVCADSSSVISDSGTARSVRERQNLLAANTATTMTVTNTCDHRKQREQCMPLAHFVANKLHPLSCTNGREPNWAGRPRGRRTVRRPLERMRSLRTAADCRQHIGRDDDTRGIGDGNRTVTRRTTSPQGAKIEWREWRKPTTWMR